MNFGVEARTQIPDLHEPIASSCLAQKKKLKFRFFMNFQRHQKLGVKSSFAPQFYMLLVTLNEGFLKKGFGTPFGTLFGTFYHYLTLLLTLRA